MNIYKVINHEADWNRALSFVCFAASEEEAKSLIPSKEQDKSFDWDEASIDLEVTLIQENVCDTPSRIFHIAETGC